MSCAPLSKARRWVRCDGVTDVRKGWGGTHISQDPGHQGDLHTESQSLPVTGVQRRVDLVSGDRWRHGLEGLEGRRNE